MLPFVAKWVVNTVVPFRVAANNSSVIYQTGADAVYVAVFSLGLNQFVPVRLPGESLRATLGNKKEENVVGSSQRR